MINAIAFRSLFNSDDVPIAYMLGDDNLFGSNIYYSEENIKAKYHDLGLTVKVNIHENIIKSKFLQSIPAPYGETHVMIRNPGRAVL